MKNPNRAFKDEIYEQFARIGKAVSSPKRLELLDLLCQGQRTVEVLAKESGLGIANASQHLQVLRAARLLEAEKDGLFVVYRLADQTVCEFFRAMRVLAESRLAEVEQIKRRFLEGREGMEPVDREALLKLVREGAVTVLDVRPVDPLERHGRGQKGADVLVAADVPLAQVVDALVGALEDGVVVLGVLLQGLDDLGRGVGAHQHP